MKRFTVRLRGLLLPLIVALFAFTLVASIYYLPGTEKAVSYFGFKHGSSWDLAHGYIANDSAVGEAHLSELASSMNASRPQPTETSHGDKLRTGTECRLSPGAADVLVVLKTGAVEVDAKMPTQLSTVFSCIPKYLIVSDMEQEFSGHYIHDALSHVNSKFKETEPEFEFQRAIKAYNDSNTDLSLLKMTDTQNLGWTLDKWKQLPALHLAYTLHPNLSWYVFIDSDTYLSFPNLLRIVKDLDPETPLYTGYEVGAGDLVFAQGGAGYLISNAAVKLFNDEFEDGGKERWEEETARASYGDGMVGFAMNNIGVPFSGLPQGRIFQDNPIAMYPEWEQMWCQPAISWHHLESLEVKQIWEWERHFLETSGNAVIRFKDTFEGLVEPKIRKGHEAGWDNMIGGKVLLPLRDKSTDEERKPWEGLEELKVDPTVSWDACEKACELDHGCLSWHFGPGKCNLGNNVRLGKKTGGDVEEQGLAISGWNMKRIQRWKKRLGHCK